MYQVPVAPVAKSQTHNEAEADGASSPAAAAMLPVFSPRPLATLRLIATSDLHASVMPYD